MKTKIGHKLEHGQIIPMMALGIFALAAMSVLLLDVGALLVNRRSAQNAADAGALAGARMKCSDVNYSDGAIENEIRDYVVENNASLMKWYFTQENLGLIVGLIKGEIVVEAKVEHESFFARIFGDELLTASASAGAGCFPYQADVVLPIAWSCRPPADGSASEDCDILKLDYADVEDVANDYLTQFPLPAGVEPTKGQAEAISDDLFELYASKIYILMDSDKVCGDDINCDFFEDGIDRDQLQSGGNRGWLSLDGEGGTSELRDWIENGSSFNLKPHTWLNGVTGNVANLYSSLSTRLDEIVWVPVFNVVCEKDPLGSTGCMNKAHKNEAPGVPLEPGQEDILIGKTNKTSFHVVAFAPFMPTCVRSQNKDECPGFSLAQDSNPGDIPDNMLTFEGYFVDPETLGEGIGFGADMGVYTVSLTR
jgi:hypothetical protein